ncbi:meiotic nuclear division protein 1 -like [Asbolus verrucosus]|uniref:Meiotic nuclear division protein 1 homolog n=1 Tax=Asbolus verrucosus TaxID=1661398 RepID=A0A482VGD4_ASBVE|nr:meiotic nuclear division protein 1 -like [Asbolus verrucosus]
MSKKGLSFEEKKTRMLQLFYEKKEFFQLKELERIAPKEKGIIANSVKDVIQALVDDGSIDTDKIAGSIYFWSFPSKLINTKKRKLEDLQGRLETSSKKLKLMKKSVEEAQVGKESMEDVSGILKEIEKLKEQKENLEAQLKAYKESDPEKLNEMKQEIQTVKEAANRWTDNIFAVKSWCKKKFMIEDKVLNKQFGIPEDLDYIE